MHPRTIPLTADSTVQFLEGGKRRNTALGLGYDSIVKNLSSKHNALSLTGMCHVCCVCAMCIMCVHVYVHTPLHTSP